MWFNRVFDICRTVHMFHLALHDGAVSLMLLELMDITVIDADFDRGDIPRTCHGCSTDRVLCRAIAPDRTMVQSRDVILNKTLAAFWSQLAAGWPWPDGYGAELSSWCPVNWVLSAFLT
jgi:hypothetical protein